MKYNFSSRPDEVNDFYLILPSTLGPEVFSASNGNEYLQQKNKFRGNRARPALKVLNSTAICERIV
jgi:hypothetical protein